MGLGLGLPGKGRVLKTAKFSKKLSLTLALALALTWQGQRVEDGEVER